MDYTDRFNGLKGIFSLSTRETPIPGSSIDITVHNFISTTSLAPPCGYLTEAFDTTRFASEDSRIEENTRFSYPIFAPRTGGKYRSAVVLLHGLNERSWAKYLPWAYYLAERLNRPVILFPISFHVNRSPESWGNPRAMSQLQQKRQSSGEARMVSFANAALSERLTENPFRFFASGRQSAEDIVALLQQVKAGDHPLFGKDTRVDFFAYSIGAFLSQILFLSNPEGLLADSRLFLFCGGSLFSQMEGTSKLIMDSEAFAKLRKYYLGDFERELKTRSTFANFFRTNPLANAFHAMLAPHCLKSFRRQTLQTMGNRIRAIALKRDVVIPAEHIKSVFAGIKGRMNGLVEVLDFPYDYSHEIPFPVLNRGASSLVDKGFEQVFSRACEFLY